MNMKFAACVMSACVVLAGPASAQESDPAKQLAVEVGTVLAIAEVCSNLELSPDFAEKAISGRGFDPNDYFGESGKFTETTRLAYGVAISGKAELENACETQALANYGAEGTVGKGYLQATKVHDAEDVIDLAKDIGRAMALANICDNLAYNMKGIGGQIASEGLPPAEFVSAKGAFFPIVEQELKSTIQLTSTKNSANFCEVGLSSYGKDGDDRPNLLQAAK